MIFTKKSIHIMIIYCLHEFSTQARLHYFNIIFLMCYIHIKVNISISVECALDSNRSGSEDVSNSQACLCTTSTTVQCLLRYSQRSVETLETLVLRTGFSNPPLPLKNICLGLFHKIINHWMHICILINLKINFCCY